MPEDRAAPGLKAEASSIMTLMKGGLTCHQYRQAGAQQQSKGVVSQPREARQPWTGSIRHPTSNTQTRMVKTGNSQVRLVCGINAK